MKRLTGTNKEIAELLYQEQLELSKENRDVERTVQAIIEDVKERGDEALRDYSAKFDKVDLTDIEVGQDLIDKAFKEIDPEVYQALVNAKENIESYHKHQLEAGFEDQPSEGVIRGLSLIHISGGNCGLSVLSPYECHPCQNCWG